MPASWMQLKRKLCGPSTRGSWCGSRIQPPLVHLTQWEHLPNQSQPMVAMIQAPCGELAIPVNPTVVAPEPVADTAIQVQSPFSLAW